MGGYNVPVEDSGLFPEHYFEVLCPGNLESICVSLCVCVCSCLGAVGGIWKGSWS